MVDSEKLGLFGGGAAAEVRPTPKPAGPVIEALRVSTGRVRREDPVLPRTGGPAGNARLTAWLGLTVLVLSLAQVVTVFDVRGWLSWHVTIGALLVPFALWKTGSTFWRFILYYAGSRPYRDAGPPPLLLRVLGPLVVLTTLSLLGTGIALVALGPTAGQRPFMTVFGQGIDDLTLHQLLFIVFCVVTGLHMLARIVPAVLLATGRQASDEQMHGPKHLPGRGFRIVVLAAALGAGVLTAVLLVRSDSSWQHGHARDGLPGPSTASTDAHRGNHL